MRNNQSRFMKRVVYKLRQSYGVNVDYYRVHSVNTDYTLGVSSNNIEKFTIKKVIRLPSKFVRLFQDDRTHTPSDRNFSAGVWFDKKQRVFLLDSKMIPKGLTPEIDDYLITDNERWDVKAIEILENNIGYMLTTEAVEGAYLEDFEALSEQIIPTELITYVLN